MSEIAVSTSTVSRTVLTVSPEERIVKNCNDDSDNVKNNPKVNVNVF